MKTILLIVGISSSFVLTAQVNPPDSDANQSTPAPQPVPPYQRPVSLGRTIPNIVDDQSKIWLFPAKLNKKRNWIPIAVILGTTAALIALDSHDAPYFRSTSTFAGFNGVFTGNATAIVPVSLYVTGLISKDSKMEGTALLAGEAVANSEILTFVLKDAFKRVRPASIPPTANFSDTWFESRGSFINSKGGCPLATPSRLSRSVVPGNVTLFLSSGPSHLLTSPHRAYMVLTLWRKTFQTAETL
jgi:hypothetical protein